MKTLKNQNRNNKQNKKPFVIILKKNSPKIHFKNSYSLLPQYPEQYP